jgi:hypothetical protein
MFNSNPSLTEYRTASLAFRTYSSYGSTKVSYNSYDPGNIVKALIEDYNRQGVTLSYDSSTVELCGTTVSYTFNTNTTFEGLQQCLTLAPEFWYFYIDQATNKVHFHPQKSAQTHTFTRGLNFNSANFLKRIEPIINEIYLTGGTDSTGANLFRHYVNQASVDLYGRQVFKYTDNRITDTATADIIAKALLAEHASPEVQATIELSAATYNNELIKPGDNVQFRGFSNNNRTSLWGVMQWGVDYWGYDVSTPETMTLQIARFDYNPDTLTTTMSTTPPDVNKRVEDIKRNLDTTQVAANPSIAVTVS